MAGRGDWHNSWPVYTQCPKTELMKDDRKRMVLNVNSLQFAIRLIRARLSGPPEWALCCCDFHPVWRFMGTLCARPLQNDVT